MVSEVLPYETIRRIIRKYTHAEVSSKACKYMQFYLSDLLIHIAKLSSQELDEINIIRAKANLPEIKRIPESIFLNLLTRTIKQTNDFKLGVVGHNNKDTTISEADEVF